MYRLGAALEEEEEGTRSNPAGGQNPSGFYNQVSLLAFFCCLSVSSFFVFALFAEMPLLIDLIRLASAGTQVPPGPFRFRSAWTYCSKIHNTLSIQTNILPMPFWDKNFQCL